VARCELHSVAEVKGQEILLTVNSLNEFDSKITGVDWRHKIENQRGAVGYNATLISNPSPQVVCKWHKVLVPKLKFAYRFHLLENSRSVGALMSTLLLPQFRNFESQPLYETSICQIQY
jgi:hypothetical protein